MVTEMDPLESLKTITWKGHRKEILNQQIYLFDKNLECDCVLISAQGKRILAHQVVLSTSSDFFRKILGELPPLLELPIIHMPDATTETLEAIIKFLYTGQIVINMCDMGKFLEFCNCLGVKCFIENELTVTKIGTEASQTISTAVQTLNSKRSSESVCEDDCLTMQADGMIDQELEYGIESIEPDYLEEYLDDESIIDVKEEQISMENDDGDDELVYGNFSAFEHPVENIEVSRSDDVSQIMMRRQNRRQGTRSSNVQIDRALNEVNNGKTIHRLSVEYNLPRSTLYHRFRNNASLKQNYRSERKNALENAVKAILDEKLR